MPGQLIALEGPSASGKSRTVATLERAVGVRAIPEAYARLRPRPSLTWHGTGALLRLERRLLREEARRYQEGRRSAELGGVVLADTGFLGPITYTAGLVRAGLADRSVLSELLRSGSELARDGRWGLPDSLVYLRTTRRERRRRASADPVGHPESLRARHERVATEELRLYRRVIGPEFGVRFRFVSGDGPPTEVAERIARRLAPPIPTGRPPSLVHILRAIGRSAGVP